MMVMNIWHSYGPFPEADLRTLIFTVKKYRAIFFENQIIKTKNMPWKQCYDVPHCKDVGSLRLSIPKKGAWLPSPA